MKPWYKQTKVGVIPENWGIGILKEAFPRLDAGVSVNSDETTASEYYVLKTSAVRDGKVNINEAKPVVSSEYSRLKCPIVKGSIVISRMNTPAMVGECGYTDVDAPRTYLPDRLWQAEPLSPDYDYRWLNYLLNTEKYGSAVRATATGTSNSMKNIAKDRLLEIAVPKPSLAEQRRIAEALSDVVELISSLEKLIAKKKAIKQGAMQELLTGKRRLPGFSGEWESCALKDIAGYSTAMVPMKGISILDYIGTDNMISNKGGIRNNEITIEYTVVREYRNGDILLSNIRPYLKKIWHADKDGGCSNDVLVIRVNNPERIEPAFLYYLLSQDSFFEEVMANAVGTKMPRGDKAVIMGYRLRIPKESYEQTAIVGILRDLDNSIEQLSQQLNKYLQIKQGMMQLLLTGKIRV